MVSGRFNFKKDKRVDSLSGISVVRDMYTRRDNNIGELNKEQDQDSQERKKKK